MNTAVPYFGEFLALLTAITWAFAVILFKKSGESVHPIALNVFKNSLAFVLFLLTMIIMGQAIYRDAPLNDYLLLLLSGILGIGIGDTLFLWSLNLLGAGLQAIVNCMYAPSIIILSFFWLDERMSIWQLVGVVMIVSAVLMAISRKGKGPISTRNLVLGIILGIIATTAMAVGIVSIKSLLERSPLLWVTEVRLLGGLLGLGLVLILHPRRRAIMATWHSKLSWRYTLSGSFIGAYLAMVLWLAGMKLAKASIASALNQMSNVFVFIFAAWLLREPINMQRLAGIFLGVSGALLVMFG